MQESLLLIVENLEQQNLDCPPLSAVARRVLALTHDSEAHASRLTAMIQGVPFCLKKSLQLVILLHMEAERK